MLLVLRDKSYPIFVLLFLSDLCVFVEDTVGQRIRVNVDNTLGGGGQRQIAVFCPYWIVNTSHYSLRITEEGSSVLPAGSVTAQK